MARSIRAAGGRPGDVLHNAYGYGLFTGGLGAHYGAEKLGCTVVPVSGGMTERQVRLIADFGPRIIMVTPSYMLAIVDEMRRQGLDPRESSLQIGIFGAEPWTDQMRAEMEEILGIDAVDIYGLSEVIGPGVAQECVETKDGLHVWEDHFYPEVVDPVTGEVLPDGEKGELVFTSLTKQAMPVIRYRTRDLTRLLPGHRADHAPDGEGHRPHRRHDHPARREPVPDPDRGAAAHAARAVAALPVRAVPPGHPRRPDRARRASRRRLAVRRRPGRRTSSSGWSRRRSASRWPSRSSPRTASSGRSARCAGSSTSGRPGR